MIQDTKIIHKIVVMTICLTIIPLIVIGTLYYNNVKSIIENEVVRSYEGMADQYVSNVNFRINVYTSLLTDITLSNSIQEVLLNKSSNYFEQTEKEKKVTQVLNSFSIGGNYREVEDITIYNIDDDFLFQGKHLKNITSITEESWFGKIDIHQRRIQWLSGIESEEILSFIKVISSMGPEKRLEITGFARLDIDKQNTFKISDKRNEGNNNILLFVMDESDEIIYKNTKNNTKPIKFLNEYTRYYTGTWASFEGIEGIVIYRDIDFRNYKAIFICPIQTIKDRIFNSLILIILVISLSGVISLIFIYFFSRSFSLRFKELLKKMNDVKKGKYDIDITVKGKDEIAVINKNFNEMVLKLNETINENYLQKIAKREAELRALQFQINPHFLYNTLECIKSMAIIHNCKDITNITQKLGNMLHYNIDDGKSEFVALNAEISQVQDYIEIQKIRMGNKIEFFFDIPEEYGECKVPKFILQPVIENLAQHGFYNKREPGLAEITLFEQDDDLYIKVQDDGVGITKDRLKEINQILKSDEGFITHIKRKSIGLQNVNSRIRMLYGNNYGISLESTEGEGTIVTIRIPKKV